IQERAKLNADVFTAIRDSMADDPELVLESVQVENIDFSGQYVQSIEQRMQAEIEVQRIQQQFQQQEVQAKITVVNAQAAADAKVTAAKADAQAIQLRGEAEASAIKARGDALKQNPDLVALTAAERWDGKLPATMVPGSALPFIGVK
ncbi:MAG: prohibitin family protein, partial [Janthinobacterium lividum]